MKPYILEGTPQDVARKIEHFSAPKVVVLIIDKIWAQTQKPKVSRQELARLLAEAKKDMVHVGHVDDSREAMYTRMPGE